MIKNEAPALLRYADCAGVAHSYNGWSLLPSGDIWITKPGARATGRQAAKRCQLRDVAIPLIDRPA